MKKLVLAAAALLLVTMGLAADGGRPSPRAQVSTPVAPASSGRTPATSKPSTVSSRPAGAPESLSAASQAQLVGQYCATCHSDRNKAGGLTLASFDASFATEHPESVEKMIRKLRAGMMPPAGARRPDEATIDALATALEGRMDAIAAANPNPGWRPFQRLTRAEYAQSVKDLVDLDVDVTPYLPPDTLSQGFDNIADAQSFSPALLEGYLRAASQVSRLAVGDRDAAPTSATYRVLAVESQMRYVEGTPLGSRGGLSVVHTFIADGEYVFKVALVRTVSGELFGNTDIAVAGKNEQLEISVNGERVALVEVNAGMSDAGEKGLTLETPPIHIAAGPQRISAAFVPHFVGPVDDMIAPIDHTLIDTRIGTGFGITAYPHVQDMTIAGPLQVTGVSDTPSRRRIFTCRPTSAPEEASCASDIVKRLASKAYRAPVAKADFDDVMAFYELGRTSGDFEAGVRLALQAILANPHFLFRLESAPATQTTGAHRVTDTELASRLSFFLWGTLPDADLLKAAADGGLRTPAALEKQVRRMLADPKAEALATRFGGQWLRLQDIDKMRPDGILYPQWDRSLSEAFGKETELFFANLVREDRSVLELLTADYTFVNERLARHYGLPNVIGPDFRRVPLPDYRRGILTQGSILLLTSVADRTSPVQRGKWVMQVMLGSPPPPPPPNVPSFEATNAVANGKVLSVRERMETHRANAACASCHRVIDPIGLALENFDVTGQYRIKDNGVPVDATGELYDGTKLDGPAGLRAALLKRKTSLLTSFTENFLTYALGRRIEHFDMPTVRHIVRDAGRHDYRMSSFILGIVGSPAFRMSRPAPTEATTVAAVER
ncbi:MAG: DUF1592 domain-containing protein [Vicinamibacterales bacterium]